MQKNANLDPVYASDRDAGSTSPQTGEAGVNVVGHPDGDRDSAGAHETTETAAQERESLSGLEALQDGGSFDGLGVPVADDSTVGP